MDPISFGAAAGAIAALGAIGVILMFGLVALLVWIDGLCLRYLIEYWGTKNKGELVRVPVPAFVLGLMVLLFAMLVPLALDAVILGAALCTYVFSFFGSNPAYVPR